MINTSLSCIYMVDPARDRALSLAIQPLYPILTRKFNELKYILS